MCHGLLHDPNFFRLLVRADEELAEATRAAGCPCGGVLHRADYPRKPRGCVTELRAEFERRFSFCCARCRKRTTAQSVRYLGRRVYVALAVVLLSVRAVTSRAGAARLAQTFAVPLRTLGRWRTWWRAQFAQTPLWQASAGRFVPPVAPEHLPASLLDRFLGSTTEAVARCLRYLSPLSVARTTALGEGC